MSDDSYGVRVEAVKLKRRVEMYQWVEERREREHKEPDGSITTETEFSYRKYTCIPPSILILPLYIICDVLICHQIKCGEGIS